MCERQYSGANVIVGVAGPVDPEAVAADVEAAFGDMRAGAMNRGGGARVARRRAHAAAGGLQRRRTW